MAIEDVLPTVILIAIVYALYRWLSGPSTHSDPLESVRRDMVEAVTSAFPDEPLPNVVYSLSRTRSAQTTSETILEGRGLPAPPPGFTVPEHLLPRSAVPSPSSVSGGGSDGGAAQKATSLIDRYGLSARLEGDRGASTGKWEATREGREADLRARKERMILEARRRMMEKEKAPAAAAGADTAKAE